MASNRLIAVKTTFRKLAKSEQKTLLTAFREQQVSVVRKFIDSGFNPAEMIEGNNPLNYCFSIDLIKLLLDAGADVNAGKDNWTPVLQHSGLGDKDIVALLIKHGADINRAYSKRHCPQQILFGFTPLMNAADQGHLSIVKLLLAAGANIDAVDKYGHDALFHAIYCNKTTVAKELLRRGGKLSRDAIGGPVYHENLPLLKILIKNKADLNCVFHAFERKGLFEQGETPLGRAVYNVGLSKRSIKIVELLLKSGAKVDQPSQYLGKSLPPICIAARCGLEEMVDLLMKAGSKLSLKEALAGYRLEGACYAGIVGLVKLHLKAGADVNAVGTDGKSPIEWAQERGRNKIVKLLRQAGAIMPLRTNRSS